MCIHVCVCVCVRVNASSPVPETSRLVAEREAIHRLMYIGENFLNCFYCIAYSYRLNGYGNI